MSNTSAINLEYLSRGPFTAFHKRKARRAVLVCHRRAGKTVATINDLIMRAVQVKKPDAFYAYVAPYKTMAKQIAWKYLLKYTRPFKDKKLATVNNQELSVTFFNGSTIRLFGADDPDSFRGLYFDGVVLDEFGDMKPSVYTEAIGPALADRDGWAVFIGTPKGHNQFYKMREIARKETDKYFYLELKASESGFVEESILEEQRQAMSPSEYQQEFECSFEAALQGSFYAENIGQIENRGQIGVVPHVPNIDVHMAWDLGFSDSTCIWFWQIVAGELRIIDFYEANRTDLETIIETIQDKPYEYGHCFLPHDSTHERLGTNKTIQEQLWDHGFDCRVIPRLKVSNGIIAVRKVLKFCWFDLENCFRGLESLKLYQKTWSQQLSMFTEQPRHDQNSHAADAFRYLALAVRDEHLTSMSDTPTQARKVDRTITTTTIKKEVIYTCPPPLEFPTRKIIRV